jgi:hypothetical protein
MKPILSERNCVIILFVLVLVTFSLAQEDSRKMEKAYQGAGLGMNKDQAPAPEKAFLPAGIR